MSSQREQCRADLQSGCAAIQTMTTVYPLDICRWLGDNFNNFSIYQHGRSFPLLVDVDDHKSVLRGEGDNLFYDMQVSWRYLHRQYQPPNLDGLNDILDGVTLKQSTPKSFSHKLNMKVSLDLVKWPLLTLNMLYINLHMALLDSKGTEKQKQQYFNNAQLFMKHFYPTVSTEIMHLAAHLGMLDDITTFKSWFHKQQVMDEVSGLVLPGSFDAQLYALA